MKIQVLSDLHIEKRGMYPFEKIEDCDVLVLAGDIGEVRSDEYVKLIEIVASMWKWVIVIKGNHECYGLTIEETDQICRDICQEYDNVIYLEKDYFDIGDVRFIGTTLWTHISPHQEKDVGEYVNDYKNILDWNTKKTITEHIDAVDFIENEIYPAIHNKKRLVIITHHAPCKNGCIREEHRNSHISSAFSSRLEYLFPCMKTGWVWIYGHTHSSGEQVLENGVRIVSNQLGKIDEETGFHSLYFIEV
jgi:predicted phosphodiesterase